MENVTAAARSPAWEFPFSVLFKSRLLFMSWVKGRGLVIRAKVGSVAIKIGPKEGEMTVPINRCLSNDFNACNHVQ